MRDFGGLLGSNDVLSENDLRRYVANVVVKTGSLSFMTRVSRLIHEEEKGVQVAVD